MPKCLPSKVAIGLRWASKTTAFASALPSNSAAPSRTGAIVSGLFQRTPPEICCASRLTTWRLLARNSSTAATLRISSWANTVPPTPMQRMTAISSPSFCDKDRRNRPWPRKSFCMILSSPALPGSHIHQHFDVEPDRDGADRGTAAIHHRHADLGLEFLGRFILLDLVDEDGIRAGRIGLLPLGLVALPVVGGHVALADIEALVVHDEDLGHETLAFGLL